MKDREKDRIADIHYERKRNSGIQERERESVCVYEREREVRKTDK